MKVLFVGCGAIGSILAAYVSAQSKVYVYDPWKEHTDVIVRNGIKVTGKAEFVAKGIIASSEPEFISSHVFDAVAVAVKSINTLEAVHTIKPHLKGRPVILTVQNGVGNEAIIAQHWVADVICQGVTSLAGTLKEPGHVTIEKIGKTWMGPIGRDDADKSAQLGSLFRNSGLDAEVLPDPRGAVWAKLLFNAAINPLTAILQIPSKHLIDISYARDIMQTVLDEGRAVARQLGIELPYNPEEAVFAPRTAAHFSSMAQDIQSGRPTEIEFINGAIIQAAKEAGLEVPVNEWLTSLVKTLEWKNKHLNEEVECQ